MRDSCAWVVLVVLVLGPGAWPCAPAQAGEALDLAAVEGMEHFPGQDAERGVLARNGFVALPRFHKQIFSPYIGGKLPYYITTDSAHHTYHVLFEAALREVEGHVARRVRSFVGRLLERLVATPEPVLAAARAGRDLACAHVAVAARLLGAAGDVVVPGAEAVAAELDLIAAGAGRAASPLFGVPEDYALYRPRGLYEGDPLLEAYFRASTWLGRRGLLVEEVRETWAALVLVRTIHEDATLRDDLAAVAGFLDAMVGPPDDLTVAEYAAVLAGVVGDDLSDERLGARHETLRTALRGLRAPEINDQVLAPDAWARFRVASKGLRLLPARRTTDARLFQALVEGAPSSGLPSGLEVAQALGSRRAATHRAAEGEAAAARVARVAEASTAFRQDLERTHHGATLALLQQLFDERAPLLVGTDAAQGAAGTPVFPPALFGSAPWHDRLLTTGLAGWTALRHAWALHAKSTMHFLGDTRDPAGIVEPAPSFFAGLATLGRALVERADAFGGFGRDPREAITTLLPLLDVLVADDPGDVDLQERFGPALRLLEAHGAALEQLCVAKGDGDDPRTGLAVVLPRLRAWLQGTGTLDADEQACVATFAASDVRARLLRFGTLMDDLARIAGQGIRGEVLSAADEDLLRDYGKTIAALHFFDGNSWLSPDRQMGFVATFAADPARGVVRETAVGAAMELYVALPLRGGGPRLYQGAVHACYEFDSPVPTTDAEWIERIAQRRMPPLPSWTASYVVAQDADALVARIRAGEIVEEVAHQRSPGLGAALLEQLESGTHATSAQDDHLGWVVRALQAYRDTPLRPRIARTLERWLVEARDVVVDADGTDVRADLGPAVAAALGGCLAAADRLRIVGLLRTPPAAAPRSLAERVVQVFEWSDDAGIAAEADALVVDEHPAVGLAGVRIRRQLLWRGIGTHEDVFRAVMTYVARTTEAVPRREALLEVSRSLEDYARYLRPEHLAIVAPLLESEDERLAEAAFAVWGHLLGTLPPDDPRVAAAVPRIEQRVAAGPWRMSVSGLEALAGMGHPAALDALARVANDRALDALLRSIAVHQLGACGERALVHLWPLCFDETKSSGSINGHELRMCDDAAEAVDTVLRGRFRWREARGDDDRREVALEALRAEARARGHGR